MTKVSKSDSLGSKYVNSTPNSLGNKYGGKDVPDSCEQPQAAFHDGCLVSGGDTSTYGYQGRTNDIETIETSQADKCAAERTHKQ